jgi:hypothetical protein
MFPFSISPFSIFDVTVFLLEFGVKPSDYITYSHSFEEVLSAKTIGIYNKTGSGLTF